MRDQSNWPQSLVGDDRVHRSVYRDPDVFVLEMERIFRRSWLFVGHESQVPNGGDFFATRLAGQPVLMVRHIQDDKVYVIFNRCGHRGAQVTAQERGNTRLFVCCYHGWSFNTDGTVHGVPLRQGYPEAYDLKCGDFDMQKVPQVEIYRGFVFAKLTAGGPDLMSHLGPMRGRIDDVVDRAPDGEIAVGGGIHKYAFPANWKLQLENVNDMYHPHASHESTVTQNGRQFQRGERAKGGAELSKDTAGNPMAAWDEAGVWACENGHGWCGAMPGTVGRGSGPVFERYEAALRAGRGDKRAEEVMNLPWLNSIFYPNLVLQAMAQHIRVIHPVAVDRTEIHVYPIILKGAPTELNREVIRYLNITHAPASLIQTDDLEAFRRIDRGLATEGAEWVVFGRGHGQTIPGNDGTRRAFGTSELPARNQYRAWRSLMQA